MNIFREIKFFILVGLKWDWKTAMQSMQDNLYGEKKYGIQTTDFDQLSELKKNGIDISHATLYMPINYRLLEDLLSQVSIYDVKHFTDIGCGMGRALCVAAHHGISEVSGIDFSKTLVNEAEKNLQLTRIKIPNLQYSVEVADAAAWSIPPKVDCLFLFNPFDEFVMKKLCAQIKNSLNKFPRNMLVIYVNPLYKDLFQKLGFKTTYVVKKMKYLEATLLFYQIAPT